MYLCWLAACAASSLGRLSELLRHDTSVSKLSSILGVRACWERSFYFSWEIDKEIWNDCPPQPCWYIFRKRRQDGTLNMPWNPAEATPWVVCDVTHKGEFVKCYVCFLGWKKSETKGLKIKSPVNRAENGRGQEKVTQVLLTYIVTLKAWRTSSVGTQRRISQCN